MLNPKKLLELKNMKDAFERRHPKFFPFLQAVSQSGISEGSILEINVTRPDGKVLSSNLRLTAEDLELLAQLKNMR